ncbi:MAG TPA: permease prefix domain 1-containing protein [Tissierellaceae bacterium]|nr:permease prefix domain 1-containing protein [Tissierellaceae bacterium]
MSFYKAQDFVEEIVSHVKFKFDRDEISSELNQHMIDKIEDYIEKGYEEKEAERLTINDMGDPEEIGLQLNKQHNPVLGWIWVMTNIGVKILITLSILIVGINILNTIFTDSGVKGIAEEKILYKIDINEKVEIDNRVIEFTNLIYEKNGDMNIFYKDYEKSLFGGPNSFEWIGYIKDDLGNEYGFKARSTRGGIVSKSRWVINDFSQDANTLIIDYNEYNRKYTVEIPLEAGETDG